jgi:hypothetical protein
MLQKTHLDIQTGFGDLVLQMNNLHQVGFESDEFSEWAPITTQVSPQLGLPVQRYRMGLAKFNNT